MNPDHPDDRLLDALLADSAALDAMRTAGLATMRRRRWHRTTRMILTGAAAAALVLWPILAWRNRPGNVSQAHSPHQTPIQNAVTARELTDDELLRQFPPGTCTLAEFNGQKRLVFLTDEAQANYFR